MSNYSDSQFAENPNTPWYKVLAFIRQDSKVLDVGCSSGNFDEVLANRRGVVVDGVELDEKDAAEARKKLRRVFNRNIESDAIDDFDHDYDAIYFGDVIEHLVDPVTTLRRVKPLLKKDGAVIFSIPNMAHMSVRLMLLAGRFEYGGTGLLDKTHLHFYDKKEVERVFAEAGYRIETLDWVHRDVPRDLLKKQLSVLGLNATRAYLDSTKSVEASAYQFVGRAVPSKTGAIGRLPGVSPPIDDFDRFLSEVRAEYEKKIHDLDIEISKLKTRIMDITNSNSWKITSPLRSFHDFWNRNRQE